MKAKVSKGQIAAECAKLRSLAPGNATEEQIDQRMEVIRQILAERAKGLEHLRKVIDHCLRELTFFPMGKEVDLAIDAVNRNAVKEWESPKKPVRTMQDVLDDIAFQKQFALDKPRWAEAVEEILAELNAELEAMKAQA